MVGRAEVEFDASGVFDGCVIVELGTVICSNGSYPALLSADQLNHSAVEFSGGTCLELADDEVLSFTLHEGDDAVLVVAAHDGVDFPVAYPRAVLCGLRPFGDMPLASHDAPGIIGPVAFSPDLPCLAQMAV